MADRDASSKEQEITVKIDNDLENGVYSNAASVHINRNEIIVDFGYMLPNVKPATMKVVSRINMGHQAAESFLNILSNGILDWRNANPAKKEQE